MDGMPGMHRMPGRGGGDDEEEEAPKKEVNTTKLYELLGVEKSASAADIKRAYLKLAREAHPDKGGDPETFKQIQHAYEILRDDAKRKLYDEHGEDGVESGGAPGAPQDIFEALFRGGGRRREEGPPKSEPTVHPIKVDLADLYAGKSVRLAVNRSVFAKDPEGSMMTRDGQRWSKSTERKILTVHIEKGMKHGQKITFEGDGDQLPNHRAGDVIFVVQQKDHDTFQRKGGDLIMKKEITLFDALTGVDFVITHLDGHKVRVRSAAGKVIKHESVLEVEDEGMPVYGHSFMKGALFIQFEVQWPDHLELTEAQRRALRSLLGGDGSKAADDKAKAAAAAGDDEAVVRELKEINMEARRGREELAREAAGSDSDEGPSGGQRVQCASS